MRRRRGSLAFWLLIAAFVLANYALVRWLVPPATCDPAVSAAPNVAVYL